jgi:uncharacterized damage-inducible protein DinB
MNQQTHLMLWDQMRLRHGIALRVIEQVPADKLGAHPIQGMRTPLELVVHMYAGVKLFSESVLSGSVQKYDEKAAVAGIQTREQLLAYVADAWSAGDKAARAVTEAQLNGMVSTPWGDPFPGFAMFGIVNDEYLHHRGQLYAFVRALGIEPVMLWDLEHSAPEYRPRQHA